MKKHLRNRPTQTQITNRYVFIILISSIIFGSTVVFAESGIPITEPSPTAIQSMELQLTINRFLITIASAALGYLLTQGKNIAGIFHKQCKCFQKATFVATPMFLLGTVLLLLWDQHTVLNQLRNGFLAPEDLLPDWSYFISLVVSLILFFFCICFIWKDQHEEQN